MTSQQFGETYLQNKDDIIAILNSKNIFDEDLLHETYIALYEYSPHPAPDEFVTTFVSFYINARDWQDEHESRFVPFDSNRLAALEIEDDSVGEDALDDHLDNNKRTTYREQSIERLHEVLDYYYAHPQPGERKPKHARKILQLYLDGLSEREIARNLKMAQPTVHQYLERTIERLKAITLILYNRGA